MKQILRAFLFLLLFTATVNTAIADEKANVTKQGTVRGRIIDATKQTLPGASIYIEKLHTGVTSDVNGFYTFSNLDPENLRKKVNPSIGLGLGHLKLNSMEFLKGIDLQIYQYEEHFVLNQRQHCCKIYVGALYLPR